MVNCSNLYYTHICCLGCIYCTIICSEVRDVAIPKGVNCFEYCSKANIIATGGVDKVIRVWHPHIFSRPTGKVFLLDLKKKKTAFKCDNFHV